MGVTIMPRKKRTIIDENIPDENEQTTTNTDIEDLVIVLSKVYKTNGAKRSFCFQTAESVDEVVIQDRHPAGGAFAVFEYNAAGDVVNTTNYDIEPKPALSNPNAPAGDLHTQMLMNELQWMRGMVMNMVGNRASEATPITEIIRAAKDIHSMSGGGGKDPMDMLIKGMELGQKSNGGAPDFKTELLQTAKEAVLPVVKLLSERQPMPTGGQHMVPTNPQTPAAIVQDAIIWLKGKIIMGLTPGLAVDWILQNGNDPQYQPILAMAVQGTVENFIELDSELNNEPYRGWFTAAIQLIKDEYAEQSGNAGDMGGGNRDVTDNAVNAKPSTAKSKLKKVV